jgi:hemolysin III
MVPRSQCSLHATKPIMSAEAASARYTLGEELANSVTHAFGLLLSVIGLVALLNAPALAGSVRAIAACTVYGATLILLYTTSTLYHCTMRPDAKRLLRTLDHLAIFLLIAGTYTPFVLIALRGTWGWTLFGIIWTLAAVGVAVELSRLRHVRGLMVALYLSMGWVGLVAIKPLAAALPAAALWLLFGGGVSYTFGVLFYQWRSLRYHHAVWHLFVLGGSVLQYFAVLYYVLPWA